MKKGDKVIIESSNEKGVVMYVNTTTNRAAVRMEDGTGRVFPFDVLKSVAKKYAKGSTIDSKISEYVKKVRENRKAKGLGEMTEKEHSDLISELQEKFNSKMAKGGSMKKDINSSIRTISFPDYFPTEDDRAYDWIRNDVSDKAQSSYFWDLLKNLSKKHSVTISNFEYPNDNNNFEFNINGAENNLKKFYAEFFNIKHSGVDSVIDRQRKDYGFFYEDENEEYAKGGDVSEANKDSLNFIKNHISIGKTEQTADLDGTIRTEILFDKKLVGYYDIDRNEDSYIYPISKEKTKNAKGLFVKKFVENPNAKYWDSVNGESKKSNRKLKYFIFTNYKMSINGDVFEDAITDMISNKYKYEDGGMVTKGDDTSAFEYSIGGL